MIVSRTTQLVSKTLYQMSIAVGFGVVVWVGFSVYYALTTTPKVEVEPQLLEPIAVELNKDELEAVTKREQMSAKIDDLFNELPIGTMAASSQKTPKTAPSTLEKPVTAQNDFESSETE